MKMVRGLEERMRDLGLFRLEKRRLRQGFISAHKSVRGRELCLQAGARLFSVVPSDRRESTGHKLKHRKFHLTMRKNLV